MRKAGKKLVGLVVALTMMCTGVSGNIIADEITTESINKEVQVVDGIYQNGIPQVFVTTTENGVDLFTDTSKEKVSASVVVKTADGEGIEAEGTGKINVRGNSTSLAQKKPYNIKFDSKVDLFGMGKAKKWSLLANTFDKSLIRTQVGMKFMVNLEEGHESGHQYTSECVPVDLYINEKYLGTYLLIESVETGSSRVDIDVDYLDDNDNVNTDMVKEYTVDGVTYKLQDVLIELANDVTSNPHRYDTEAYYFTTDRLGMCLSLNEPERNVDAGYGYEANDDNKPVFVTEIKKFIDAMEVTMKSPNYPSYAAQLEAVAQYMDLESFIDFYITSELFMTKDISFSSTRFYIKDGKLYAGPLWDLDLSSGNIIDHESYKDFYAQGFSWFGVLMGNTEFNKMVRERYKELQSSIIRIYSDGGMIDNAYEEIKESAKCNYENAYNVFSSSKNDYCNGWGYDSIYGITHVVWWGDDASNLSANNGVYGSKQVYEDYESYVTSFKEWMKNRNEWLLSSWNIEMSDNIEGGIEINGFQVSDTAEGLRTVYSVDSCIDGKVVVSSGIIYSLAERAPETELYVGSEHEYVMAVKSTDYGLRNNSVSTSDIAFSYAMTMQFAKGYPEEYQDKWNVRAYAELADGTYIYSNIEEYTVYDIADYLYQEKLMATSLGHMYLYKKVLSVVNEDYEMIAYQ